MRIDKLIFRCLLVIFLFLLQAMTTELFAASKIVVTDFLVEPHRVYMRDESGKRVDYDETHRSTTVKSGWWMTAKDQYYNENIGMHARSILAKKLGGRLNTSLQPQLDSNVMDKRKALAKQLNLTDAGLIRAVAKISPVRLAREVGADYVVFGKFEKIVTSSNRFWGGISSAISVTVTVTNVKTGQCVFSNQYRTTKWGRSQYGAFDKLSNTIVRDIFEALCVQ